MQEYLERLFPILSKGNNNNNNNNNNKNGGVNEKTLNLSDILDFFEFCVFLLLKSILNGLFTVCGIIIKFAFVLLMTYAFAFGIFYYFENYGPEELKRKPSGTKLKRPSEFISSQDDIGKNYPYIIDYPLRADESINKRGPSSSKDRSSKDDKSKILENLQTTVKSGENVDNFKKISSPLSLVSDEKVVRVGSFKRPSDEQKSSIGRALEELSNIETKTRSSDVSKSLSLAKAEIEKDMSSHA